MHCTAVTIRPIAEAEVALVEDQINFDWAASGKHRDRFERQQAGDVVYLVSWLGDRPVGHALIKWVGFDSEPMLSRLRECADIEDLFIVPDLRSRGIGSLLLGHAEYLALECGYTQIGLGVGVDNPGARRLYERRGYAESGFGVYETCWYYQDEESRKRCATEVWEYLIRQLR